MTSLLMRIGTHDGSFHTDDVLAVAILTTIYPNHQIVRSRDPDIWEMMDILVDVGDVYDDYIGRYDHHMKNPPRDSHAHILSSAGLIWRHFAKTYIEAIGIPNRFTYNDKVFDLFSEIEKNIRTHWINPIDRVDNGIAQDPTPISDIVRAMRPTDPEKSKKRYDAAFLETVSMVSHLFKRACFHSADHVIAKVKSAQEEKKYLADGKIIVAQYAIPHYKSLSDSSVHFVIHPCEEYKEPDHYFIIRPISIPNRRMFKSPFPETLLGASRAEIADHLKIEGIRYIHHTGFLALADTQESAIDFCIKLVSRDLN